jgi:hypothetical protein
MVYRLLKQFPLTGVNGNLLDHLEGVFGDNKGYC